MTNDNSQSCTSSQEREAESLPTSSTATESSEQSSGKSIPAECLKRDKMMGSCLHSPFGVVTSETSTKFTQMRIRAWLISLRAAGPVSPTPSPGRNSEPKIQGKDGPISAKPFASFNPDGYLEKMSGGCSQLTMDGTFEEYCETFPTSGTMRHGKLYPRPMSAHLTAATGSGLWRTPAAQEPGISVDRLRPIDGGVLGGNNRHFDKHTGRMAQFGLTQQVELKKRLWATPRSGKTSSEKPETWQKRKDKGDVSTPPLAMQVAMRERTAATGSGLWPTPKTPTGGWQVKRTTPGGGIRKLEDKVSAILGYNTGSLNPAWVSWLQGWPVDLTGETQWDWTSLEPCPPGVMETWRQMTLDGTWWARDPADGEVPTSFPTLHGFSGTDGGGCELNSAMRVKEGLSASIRSGGKLGDASVSPSHGPVPRTATGIKDRVNRLKALGNGQVSLTAAMAWNILEGEQS